MQAGYKLLLYCSPDWWLLNATHHGVGAASDEDSPGDVQINNKISRVIVQWMHECMAMSHL